MSDVVALLLGLHGPWVYAAVAVLVFLEAAALVGLVVPGETALLAAGALAAHGSLSAPVLAVVAVVAALAGDSTGFWLGRRWGSRLRAGRLGRRVGEARWARADRFLTRRGPSAVVVGRWVGVLRALVPAAAGTGRMPYRRFLAADVVGVTSWVPGVVLLGYAAGGSVAAASSVLGGVSAMAVLAILVALAVVVVRRRVHRHRTGTETPPAPSAPAPERVLVSPR